MNVMRKGRIVQKQKTRRALLEAARYFLDLGHTPSVSEAADYAGMSRATAYRYFSTPEALAQDAALDRLSAEIEGIVIGLARGAQAEEAAADAMARYLAMVMRNEPLFRAYMALAARGDGAGPLGARRLNWLRAAFAPLASVMPQARYDRLVTALCVLAGVESVVVLRDVCELSVEETEETIRWMVSSLVRASLEV